MTRPIGVTPPRHLRRVEPAAVVAPKRERAPRWLTPLLVCLFVAAGVLFALNYLATADERRRLATTAQQACEAGVVVPSPDGALLCATAQQAQMTPLPGIPGAPGEPGRGITSTTIRDGHLIVTYSDGASDDLGVIVGEDGAPGEPGRGITGTALVGVRLVVSYTDGSTEDVGIVVGPAGRGIASASTAGGRLVLTYTDGSTEDVGPLPPGPAGPAGVDGAPAPSVQSTTETYTDGSTKTCIRTGGPDTDPIFTCTTTAPTTAAASPTDLPPTLGG